MIGAATPVGATDLVISGSDTRSGETIDIDGSIYVETGASVSWTDVTVTFNSTSPDPVGIYIDGGTTVNFLRVSVGIVPGTTLYWFQINNSASFTAEESDFGWMNGTATDPGGSSAAASTDFSQLVGGVQVYSTGARIGNSTFHDGLGTNLYISGASPRINDNRLFDARYVLFEYATSYSGGRQTSDYRAVAACAVVASGTVDLDSNRFERCGADGSANATDLGGSGATLATSNLRLIAAGLVVLGGAPNMVSNEILEVGNFSSATRNFALGNVSVTHNLIRLASWGGLFKGASGATMGGGYISGVGTALEFYQNSTYACCQSTFDLYSITINGSFTSGVVAQFRDHSQAVTFSVDGFTFGPGSSVIARVQFLSLGNSHSATLKGSTVDVNSAGTGIEVFDAASTGALTVEIATNAFTRVRAPVSVGLDSISGGASLNIHHNTMTLTSGTTNGTATPTQRGAVDVRWVNVQPGTLDIKVDSNTIATQNWQLGGSFSSGVSLYSLSSRAVTNFFVRSNTISNVSEAIYIYENYAGLAQSTTYNVSGNSVTVTTNQGIYIFSNSNQGNIAPDFDSNTIDRAGSVGTYALFWQIPSATISPSNFGNNSVYGHGTTRCCGIYLLGNVNKWIITIVDTLVFNTTIGLQLSQVNAYIFNTNVSNTGTGITCQDCVARLESVEIYELSAQVSGLGAYVSKFNVFQSDRVQWQGDGGLLITSGNLYLKWAAGTGQSMGTIPLTPCACVSPRWVLAWHKTPTLGDVYGNLTPQWGGDLISGLNIPFQTDFDGNITIMDPELPTLTYQTPGAGSQLRSFSVNVKGFAEDHTTGLEVVQVSIDGFNFTNVTNIDNNTHLWEHTVTFPADGVYTITLHAWDHARWAIAFGDFSTNFKEVNITGIVVDTRAPSVQITNPSVDFTTRLTSWTVEGFAADGLGGAIDVFRFTYNGNDIAASLNGVGYFSVPITGLREGPNLISVLATDLAGNTNIATRTIVLDTIPPRLIIFSPLNNSFTNRAGIAISGENEQDVILDINGIVFDSFPYPFTLRQGENHIWIRAQDRGNNTQNLELVVTLDRTAPSVIFTAPARFPFATRDPHVIMVGRANEPLMGLQVNGVTYPLYGAAPQDFSFELYLEDGSHAVLVVVTDLANNSFEYNAGPVVVDTSAPSLHIDSPADKSVTQQRQLTFHGRTDPNAFLNVTTPSGRNPWDVNPVTGEFTFTDTRVSDGVFEFTFDASDAVGNVRSVLVTITVDTRPPSIEVLGIPPEYETADEIVNFHGTVSPGTTLRVIVRKPDNSVNANGDPVAVECGGVLGSECTYNFNLPFTEGLSTVTLLATDQAGNQEAREVHVLRTVEPVAAPTSVAPYLALAGLAAGLVTLPIFLNRFRGQARAKDPTAAMPAKPARAARVAPAPPPMPVYEEQPVDMYADDAMRRQPRAPRGGM